MVLPACCCLSKGVNVGPPTLQNTRTEEVLARNSDQEPHEKLRWVWAGDGRAADGTFLGLNSYETSGGTRVSITHGKFSSPTAAQKELGLWLKQATRIIERKVRKNPSGQPIGVRARGVFPSAKPHEEYSAILWTDGDKYYWVSSPSLELALQVEEELNSHSFHHSLESSQ
jgi:hypothetical protein